MVIRIRKRSRKFLGSRRWGYGNVKNNRGSGDRGGVGRAGKKHKMTQIVVYDKDRFHKRGFKSWRSYKLKEINLDQISARAGSSGERPTIELKGYKVLSNGMLTKAVVVRATGFSGKAAEKIKQAGGEAIKL